MKNPLKDGVLTENSAGLETVTRKMVRERAIELAVIDVRPAHEATKANWEQAMGQLTGDPQMSPSDAALEATAESGQWDPAHGSTGTKVPVASGEDEDTEGRSDNKRLVDEGIGGAEHAQRRQAAKLAAEKDKGPN